MNHGTLLIITMAANLISCVIIKYLTEKFENGSVANNFFNLVTSVVVAITLFMVSGSMKASLFTIILGIVFGLTTAVQRIAYLKALEIGPLSYTTVIISLSMLIPTLSGAVIWGEHIHLVQIAGIILMIGCLILSVDKDSEEKKTSFKWLFFCGFGFLGCGMIGVMQKWHQSTVYKGELNQFLIIAFIISAIYSAVSIIAAGKNTKLQSGEENGSAKKKLTSTVPLILMIICGVGIAVNNLLNLYLSGAMDSAVFFPIVNGGGLVLTTLSALILFKERLSVRRWIGILLGIIAVILLCNPFT